MFEGKYTSAFAFRVKLTQAEVDQSVFDSLDCLLSAKNINLALWKQAVAVLVRPITP